MRREKISKKLAAQNGRDKLIGHLGAERK